MSAIQATGEALYLGVHQFAYAMAPYHPFEQRVSIEGPRPAEAHRGNVGVI